MLEDGSGDVVFSDPSLFAEGVFSEEGDSGNSVSGNFVEDLSLPVI